MAAHTYWRINVTANDGDVNFLAMAEVEMRATLGGADQCTGGTATASTFTTGGEPALAVDNDNSTRWSTSIGVLTGWWRYQFAAPVSVTEYTIRSHPITAGRSPRDFTLEYSDDGVAWTVADTRVGVTGWPVSETRTFVANLGAGSGAYSRWMLSIGANDGFGGFVALYEVQMRATVGGADQCTGGTASASSVDASSTAADAVDDNTATRWITASPNESGWWQYEFASPVSVAEYLITTSTSSPNVAPSTWNLLASNDGVDWYLINSQNGQTGWTSGETRTFETAVVTDAHVTQAALLALSVSDSDVRTTQSVALVLAQENNTVVNVTQAALLVMYQNNAEFVRNTQATALILAEYEAGIRSTQVVTLVLADQVNCVTRWSQVWTLTRLDGEVFGFTSHDMPISWRGVVHSPCNSLMGSAAELSTIAGSTGNMELNGILSDLGVSEFDIHGGLFDGATVESWMVPWSNSGGELPFRIMGGTVGPANFGETDFKLEIFSDGAKFQQKALLETYTPACRYGFGNENDPRCPVDLSALMVSGVVTSAAIPNASTSSTRRIFSDSGRIEADGYFNMGIITWVTGQNAGSSSEIKSYVGGQIALWDSMLYPIMTGDEYTATPGCDRSPSNHLLFNADMIDFGGFPDVPGNDSILQSPDAKG